MTGPDRPAQVEQNLARWDNEGGTPDRALPDAFANALPEGITERTVREYMVGSYRYTDLALAIAERDRQHELSGN
jgi:hypothetical protein